MATGITGLIIKESMMAAIREPLEMMWEIRKYLIRLHKVIMIIINWISIP